MYYYSLHILRNCDDTGGGGAMYADCQLAVKRSSVLQSHW